MTHRILQGDALAVLKTLPSESVDCCITSPPYWGLRDYGVEGQIGLEKTPEEYVAKMVDIFREVRRVLKKEGIIFLNLGDSYMSGGGASRHWGYTDPKYKNGRKVEHFEPTAYPHPIIKPKDLVGIPWTVVFALRLDGWYLRQDIIWHKPNPMPESVTDRCTKNHEYVFLLAKSQKYYFDAEAIKEKSIWFDKDARSKFGRVPHKSGKSIMQESQYAINGVGYSADGMRNKRSVWTITTAPFSEAHFAVFPEALVEPMIKAGTSEKGVCPDCGKAWERIMESKPAESTNCPKTQLAYEARGGIGIPTGTVGKSGSGRIEGYSITLCWQPICNCNKEPMPATVLDIFCGSGTTGVVAKKLGRNFIGIELKEDYCKLAEERIAGFERKDWKMKKTHIKLDDII